MQERRLDQGKDDEHVHRRLARQSGGAYLFGDAEAAVNFHGAGVAPLHLGQELRGVFLLDEDAAHAQLAECDGERQPHGSGADDENLRIQALRPRNPGEKRKLSCR